MWAGENGNMNHIEVIARIILTHNNTLLLDYVADGDYYYMPGGHVEYGETLADCLHRELDEENGARIRVGRQLQTFENIFSDTHGRHHEYLILHDGVLMSHPDGLTDREEKITHRFVPFHELGGIRILPESMHRYLVKYLGQNLPRI